MLRFSANLSLLFTEVALIDRFHLAKQAGFSAVEIQFPYGIEAFALQQCLEEHQLRLVQFNVAADDLLDGGEGLAAVPEKKIQFQAALTETVSYARLLKPHAINILPGRCFVPERRHDYWETFKGNLRLALEALSPLGVKTVFEAINTLDMPGFIINSHRELLAILDEVNDPELFMQYDLYHMSRMQENVLPFLQQHIDKIGHIQFADCPGRGQPGSGHIDFNSIFQLLNDSTYQGWVGAEYNPIGNSMQSLGWLRSLSS